MQIDITRQCGCCGAKPGKSCANDCDTNELTAYVFERPDGYRFVMGFGMGSGATHQLLTMTKARELQGEHVRLVATVTMKVPQLPVYEVAATVGGEDWRPFAHDTIRSEER